MLNFTKAEVLGLDIGSSTVKVVRLRKDDGDYAVTGAGVSEIAPDASFSAANDIGGEDDNHQQWCHLTNYRLKAKFTSPKPTAKT